MAMVEYETCSLKTKNLKVIKNKVFLRLKYFLELNFNKNVTVALCRQIFSILNY